MKPGRNAPCPCGSGKKYKKCCLHKDEEDRRTISAVMGDEYALGGMGFTSSKKTSDKDFASCEESLFLESLPFTPYSIAKMAENPGADLLSKDAELRLAWEEAMRTRWTISKVARMTTEDIIAQLDRYGVPFSREDFLEKARKTCSAWKISEDWRAENEVLCKGLDMDFVGFAACELWKRLLPERPSIEMLDDWMQEGYEQAEWDRSKECCDIWLKTWDVLRERFTPEMAELDDTAPVFSGVQYLYNWCQDLCDCLRSVSIDCPEYAVRGRRYCLEFLEQFHLEKESIQVNFREYLACCYFQLGEAEEGLNMLRLIIERWPKNVWGYIYLADAYGHVFGHDRAVPFDPAKANEFLDHALANADLREYDEETIKDRRKMIAKAARDMEGP